MNKKIAIILTAFSLCLTLTACDELIGDKDEVIIVDDSKDDTSESGNEDSKTEDTEKPADDVEMIDTEVDDNHSDKDPLEEDSLGNTKDSSDDVSDDSQADDEQADGQDESKPDSEGTEDETEEEPKEPVGEPGKNYIASSEEFAYNTKEIRNLMYDYEQSEKKIAFLTFDDGLNNQITPKVLDTLKEKGVHATFFAIGNTIYPDNAAIIKRTYEEGHALATHSVAHDYNKLYPGGKANPEYIIGEYQGQVRRYREVLGEDFDTKVWRYPGGHMSWNKKALKASDQALADLGVNWIDWNAMNGDAQSKNAGGEYNIARPNSVDDVIFNIDKSIRLNGSPNVIVVLMHDAPDKELTAKALGPMIDHLKEKGYEFGILK